MNTTDIIDTTEKTVPKKPAKAAAIVSLALLPVTFAFLEIMLHLTAHEAFRAVPTVGMILVAFAAGLIPTLVCMIPRSHRFGGWLCFAFAELSTIFFLLMHFVNDSFHVFMDPASLLVGTGGALGDFLSTILALIAQGIPTILLFHVPALVILVLAIRGEIRLNRSGAWQPITAAVLFIVLAVGGPLTLTANEADRQKYTSEFGFDTSVRTFGLLTSLKLDTIYRTFGNPFDVLDFEPIPDPAPIDPVGPDDPVEPDEPDEPIPEPVPEYGWNSMDIDFDTIIANTTDPTLKSLHQYAASLTPSRQNEYTGLFEGKNLILITAEAFSKELIDEERTPALYRLANKGIVFEDYYQPTWGGSTSTGEFSVISGIIPANKIYSVRQTAGYNFYLTMGNQLMRLGYKSGAYHNGSYTYYDRHLTHTYYGYSEFIGMGNGMEAGVKSCWPESDLEMFSYIMPKFIDGGEPFSVYFMSVSGHCAYNRMGNSMSLRHYDKFASMDASEEIKCYHAANYDFELAMEYLLDALEEAGIADDTVIAISADHYPYGLEESATWATTQNYLPELYGFTPTNNAQRDHNALIIWSGCLEDREEPVTVSGPTYSIDILPTLSNLFGVEYDSRLLVGRDALSDTMALVIWPDYSWKTDRGYYHGPSGVFYPTDGAEPADAAYIENVKSIVRNKMTFSKGLLGYNYMNYIFK